MVVLFQIEACIERNRAGRSHSEKHYICSLIASKQVTAFRIFNLIMRLIVEFESYLRFPHVGFHVRI